MYTLQNTIKISDLRKHTAEVIEEISEADEPVYVFSRSKPKVIIMSCDAFEIVKKSASKPKTKPVKTGIDFFIDPPEDFLIKKKGIDAVKAIRAERD